MKTYLKKTKERRNGWILRHDPSQLPVPNVLQHGREIVVRHWVTVVAPTADVLEVFGGVILCRKLPHCVDPNREATEGVQCPHWPLQPLWHQDKHE